MYEAFGLQNSATVLTKAYKAPLVYLSLYTKNGLIFG